MWQFFENYTTNCVITNIEKDIEKNNSFVYPNPFTNKIRLLNTKKTENYSLLNCFGQVVWTGKNIEQKDFTELACGLYFLQLENKTIKLVKQ
jgi:hypothetical protein